MIIPEGVSDYFALSGHKKDTTGIHIYLEEQNAIPVEYQNNKLRIMYKSCGLSK